MKKLILLILAAALLLAGCGGAETPAPAEETPSPAPAEEPPSPTPTPEGLTEEFILADRTGEIRDLVAKAAEGASLQDELARVEARAAKYGEYVAMADTQSDAAQLAQWPLALWDAELNSLWTRLKDVLGADAMKELTAEEVNWIAFRDEAAAEATEGYRGGSIYPMLYSLECARLTRNRAYFLASMLARAISEPFALPEREICAQYLDTAGTATVFKRLMITQSVESGYDAVLYVAGTGTIRGTATPAGEGKILFESDNGGIAAEIMYGWTGASFTVTRSEGGPFGLGAVYILPTAL